MPLSGRTSSQPSASEPFFLLDQCLSHRIAPQVTRATGLHFTPVKDEWPDRDLDVNPPGDWEIVPHLGAKAGYRSVWITLDWGAFRQHSTLIHDSRISVLWLRGEESRNFPTLSRLQQAQLLISVIATVHRLIVESDSPVYLLARLDSVPGSLPILERLRGTVLDRPTEWQRVPLT